MKMKDLRELTKEELLHRHDELWSELFGMRIKHTLGQLENPLQLRGTRRDIARVRTLLRQQGVVEVPRRKRASAARPAAKKSTKTQAARDKGSAGSSAGTGATKKE